ncbi:MAG: hypothetical protein NZ700_06755 [Gemmataceae bacterium]|nr:hypothetical protein [Gemmataceae bacterium]MDW8264778.1 hypothetical protein [Gemmataceae bacterium]
MDALQHWMETASVQELATVHYFFRSVEKSIPEGRSPREVTLAEVMQLVLDRFAARRQGRSALTGEKASATDRGQ